MAAKDRCRLRAPIIRSYGALPGSLKYFRTQAMSATTPNLKASLVHIAGKPSKGRNYDAVVWSPAATKWDARKPTEGAKDVSQPTQVLAMAVRESASEGGYTVGARRGWPSRPPAHEPLVALPPPANFGAGGKTREAWEKKPRAGGAKVVRRSTTLPRTSMPSIPPESSCARNVIAHTKVCVCVLSLEFQCSHKQTHPPNPIHVMLMRWRCARAPRGGGSPAVLPHTLGPPRDRGCAPPSPPCPGGKRHPGTATP